VEDACSAAEACDPELGCVECAPSTGSVCVGDALLECNADGTLGDTVSDCHPTCSDECAVSACADGEGIYLIDDVGRWLRFDPATNALADVGDLDCPGELPMIELSTDPPTPARPYSMTIDPSGKVWVLATSGNIHWFPVDDPDACERSPYQKPGEGFRLFGLGFTGPSLEGGELYIAGGEVGERPVQLGALPVGTLEADAIAELPEHEEAPEIAGNALGQLFAYYPGEDAALVARLDPANGSVVQSWPVPTVDQQLQAWSVAYWEGTIYLFTTTTSLGFSRTQLWALDPATGNVNVLDTSLDNVIVAGSASLCTAEPNPE
jgi:hypothetical protein